MVKLKNSRKNQNINFKKRFQTLVLQPKFAPLTFVLAFALVGGGYFVYKSFAQTSTVLTFDFWDPGESVNLLSQFETNSNSKKGVEIVILNNDYSYPGKASFSTSKLSTVKGVGVTLYDGNYKACAIGKVTTPLMNGHFRVTLKPDKPIGLRINLRDIGFTLHQTADYGQLVCAQFSYRQTPSELVFTLENDTPNALARISSIAITKTN